jgi:catechol 2,3-dioxygenase-like lactoylglutathione lyase family enzyme
LIAQEDSMPQLVTTGFHHVTLVCRDARQTMRFYRDILGLAMVKVTVNFDRTDTYHLYFGNEARPLWRRRNSSRRPGHKG